jgi:hypothetical protein
MIHFLAHTGCKPQPAPAGGVSFARRRIVLLRKVSLVLAVVAVTSCVGLGCVSSAEAETRFSVASTMKTLNHALGEDPRLEGFAGYGTAEREQIIKGLGIDEYLNVQYREGSPGELADHYELSIGAEAKGEVESYSEMLVDDAREESTTGITTEQAGGETLDAEAGEEGVASPIEELLPVIGLAAIDAVVIGHDVMEVESDLSQVPGEEAEALAAEKEVWVKVDPVTGETSTFSEEIESGGPHEPWQRSGEVVVEGEQVHTELLYNGYFPGELSPPTLGAGEPYYVLAAEVDGAWTAAAPTAELQHPVTPGWPYGNYTSEDEAEGCEESSWIRPAYLAGWPPNLKHGRLMLSPRTYHAECTPWDLAEGKRVYKPKKEWRGMQSYWWRTPAEMPVKFPNPSRTCSGECPEIAVPSLPSIDKLGERGEAQFPGTGGNDHLAVEEWLEAAPMSGETPQPSQAEIEEVTYEYVQNNSKATQTKDELEVAARTCLEKMLSLRLTPAVSIANCIKLPIFFSGSDVPTATEHDERALEENPRWLLLNYESRAEKRAKGVSPKWYEGKGGCEKPKPEGDSCDEYPFYSSEQGGPEAEVYPSIEWVNAIDNETQGRRYGNFVVACKLTKGALFAGVPLKPSLSIPTFFLCNNGT